MAEDGEQHHRESKARADIQMRIVLDARSYADVGQLMDDVQEAIEALLVGHPKARFDFVAFNTHPCKAISMDDHLHRSINQAVAMERGDDQPEPW